MPSSRTRKKQRAGPKDSPLISSRRRRKVNFRATPKVSKKITIMFRHGGKKIIFTKKQKVKKPTKIRFRRTFIPDGKWRIKPSNEPPIRNVWLFEQFRAFEELNIHLRERKEA